jgi:hypothetical protein
MRIQARESPAKKRIISHRMDLPLNASVPFIAQAILMRRPPAGPPFKVHGSPRCSPVLVWVGRAPLKSCSHHSLWMMIHRCPSRLQSCNARKATAAAGTLSIACITKKSAAATPKYPSTAPTHCLGRIDGQLSGIGRLCNIARVRFSRLSFRLWFLKT